VKLFERVPGATVQGSGAPANTTVLAQVQMRDPTQNSTFLYRQYVTSDANGNFEMTLPYSTTGYDEYGPENGYTNVSVRAQSQYQFYSVQQQLVVDEDGNQSLSYRQWTANTNVSEGAVNGATDEPVTVVLEEQTNNSSEE
jgi:dolichyl-diphosphooligosaccharide--protein glycosyltransferase